MRARGFDGTLPARAQGGFGRAAWGFLLCRWLALPALLGGLLAGGGS